MHGTLRLNLDKIENLIKDKDETLRPWNEDDDPEECGPFHGKEAFKMLKSNKNLETKDVAKISQEMKKHHHTKTCHKRDTHTRHTQ